MTGRPVAGCEECGHPIDLNQPGYYKTPDERFWHEECHEDGEKSADDVYEDRNLLACALAQATHAPSGWKPDPESTDEWAIVWIETPLGQISYHVPQEMAADLAPPQRDAEYDGYDRITKNGRVERWCQGGCWS